MEAKRFWRMALRIGILCFVLMAIFWGGWSLSASVPNSGYLKISDSWMLNINPDIGISYRLLDIPAAFLYFFVYALLVRGYLKLLDLRDRYDFLVMFIPGLASGIVAGFVMGLVEGTKAGLGIGLLFGIFLIPVFAAIITFTLGLLFGFLYLFANVDVGKFFDRTGLKIACRWLLAKT